MGLVLSSLRDGLEGVTSRKESQQSQHNPLGNCGNDEVIGVRHVPQMSVELCCESLGDGLGKCYAGYVGGSYHRIVSIGNSEFRRRSHLIQ